MTRISSGFAGAEAGIDSGCFTALKRPSSTLAHAVALLRSFLIENQSTMVTSAVTFARTLALTSAKI
jgi:hypothetical protein